MTTSLFTSHIHSSAEICVALGNVLLLSTTRYNNTSRGVAHRMKKGDPTALRMAAEKMVACLPENCVIVPAPSHEGYAKQTLQLATIMANLSGVEVHDVLRGISRMSNYDAKRQGTPLKPSDLGLHLVDGLPEDKTVVVVDNVVDTGCTAFAAARVIGTCAVLSYAMTQVIA